MDVVGHSIDTEHFVTIILHDAGNVSVELVFPTFVNQALAAFDSKDDLDADLSFSTNAAPRWGWYGLLFFYQCCAPMGLGDNLGF